MADTDLLFAQPGPSSTDLVFGATFVAPLCEIAISGMFAPLTVAVRIGPPCDLAIAGAFAPLAVLAEVQYITNTERPIVARAKTLFQDGGRASQSSGHAFQDATAYTATVSAPYQDAQALKSHQVVTMADGLRAQVLQGIVFEDATHVDTQAVGIAQDGQKLRTDRVGVFQDGVGVRQSRDMRFQDGLSDRRNLTTTRFQDARYLCSATAATAGYAVPRVARLGSRFQEGRRPPAGIARPVVPPVVDPCYTPDPNLVFVELPGFGNLVFICERHQPPVPGAPLVIRPARLYMFVHTVFAQRLPDLAEVPLFDATVSADAGSFCWTLSATGPSSLFTQLAPVDGLPVRLRVTLDGIPWVFAVDSLSRSSAFGKTGVNISGRSVTALIGAPYLRATTRTNTQERLAQQLALDALQNTGVDLDWGLTDWIVPTAAWSHQGTPLDAVQAIAQAAGGYLQSHRSEATLLTRHPYSQRAGDLPGAPWGWMTGAADVELATDAVITEALERRDGPDTNAVYVSGTAQGVLAQVKRTGSAADKLAAMVTDALITDAIAARQRGLSILGAAGPQYNVSMTLPVLTGVGQPGVLNVGQLVQINAAQPWRGRVRAVSVSAKAPTLRQSITLERHL